MTTVQFIMLATLGGLLSLDSVSVGQVMLARPIVAATLAGAIFGHPELGIVAGALLEMVALETMPFGASRYLEWSAASIAGAVAVCTSGSLGVASLTAALLVALPTAWIAGASLVLLRRANGRLLQAAIPELEAGSGRAVSRLQLAGISMDFVRGAVVTLLASVVAFFLSHFLVEATAGSAVLTRAAVVAIPAAVAVAASWRLFAAGSRRRFLFLGGAIVGISLLHII